MKPNRLFPAIAGLIFLFLALSACAPQAIETLEATNTLEPGPSQTAVFPTRPPVETVAPTPFPTAPPPLPTSTPVVEARVVELEWPPRMRLGESDIIRLAVIPAEGGYTVQAEFPEHAVATQEVPVPRPGGYALSALARLDGVGFDLAPMGIQERALPLGEPVSWRWSLTPRNSGQQRLSLTLTLRWVPASGVSGSEREVLVYSKGLDVRVISFLGLTHGQAMTTGLFGLIFGGGLSLMAFMVRGRPAPAVLRTVSPNLGLTIEPHPELALSTAERPLLQSLFRQYRRLVLEREFLSGYSGARTFLALPIRPDGRSDAYTIVKIGQRKAIEREFENYETFVKDTLPPITARIQHPPVTVRGGALAALRYTFIGDPGSGLAGQSAGSGQSLRQALLEGGDASLLYQLFETFGPNWWMQRRPYTFRLAQEYDRMLPTCYVVEPASGRGFDLDGRQPPMERGLQPGQLVTLRGFSHLERRADGRSLSLKGEIHPGYPPLRVRWLSLEDPNGAAGRVVADRGSILRETVAGFELYGLQDPLARLGSILNEKVAGTQATIHGDLNLENVLVGPGGIVWLIDFAQTRDGHPLFDFAHLEAEIIAHVLAVQVKGPEDFLELLKSGSHPLLQAMEEIAGRCLFDPDHIREYDLARYMACVGALKFVNLGPEAKQLLYLTAAYLAQSL